MADGTTDFPVKHSTPYGVLVAGKFDELADYVVQRPTSQHDWLLMYTISGTGFVQFEQKTNICHAGEAILLLPGMNHHYGTYGSSWLFLWVHFIPDPEWRTWLRFPHGKQLIHIPIPSDNERRQIEQSLMKMVDFIHYSYDFRTARLSNLALEEALLHLSLALPSDERSLMDPRIHDTLQYLQQFYNKKISIPNLAKQNCLSVSRLSHLFKEQVGDTIISTIHKLRLEKSAQLLLQTNRQVSEISIDVGFDSVDHFTRLFTASYRMSPSKYRSSNRMTK